MSRPLVRRRVEHRLVVLLENAVLEPRVPRPPRVPQFVALANVLNALGEVLVLT